MSNENKHAAAQYILGFASHVGYLTHFYSNYENMLIEFGAKYGIEELEQKLTAQEKDNLTKICQTIRYYATQAKISYAAIMQGSKKEEDKEVYKLYDKVKEQFIIKRKDLEAYVTKFNAILISTIIKDLLESSQEYINQLYSSELPPAQNG